MSICILRIGDGRDEYHERAQASAAEHLPQFAHQVTIDDREHELGFAGAIQEGWRQVIETGADWVFHLEMDFTFNVEIPVDRMTAVLKRHPYLVQMALKRQPVNEREREAGDMLAALEIDGDCFQQHVEHGDIWTEHRKFFTTNPCVYSANLCRQGWPQEAESEGKFAIRLFEDPKARSGVWGGLHDDPLVEHIGDARNGHGY